MTFLAEGHNMGNYCIYLRKSRADLDAEAHGEGETLARHEKALVELAHRQGINITKIYREVVSGETIASRPVMQQLLSDVGNRLWAGVLVMEIERLARGDTMDQGIVAQAFKFSYTKIITPQKTYDPNNEFDEEYFEFGLFMSRREYKVINRRLQNGRLASVKEGKYLGSKAPYGYRKVKLAHEKGYTLEIIPEQADTVRLIFDLYVNGESRNRGGQTRIGVNLIARRLNELHIPSYSGREWSSASIRDIISNPVYIGKIRWNWRPTAKRMEHGVVKISRPKNNIDQCLCVDGLHEPIITEEIYKMAQELIANNPPRPVKEHNVIRNPLAGIVVCGKCGRNMIRKPYKNKEYPDSLLCPYPTCNNVSSHLYMVEQRILDMLADWLNESKLLYDVENKDNMQIEALDKSLKKAQQEIQSLENQRNNIHDFLERGIYDTDTFLDRMQIISARMEDIQAECAALERTLKEVMEQNEIRQNILPKIDNLLTGYNAIKSPAEKNRLLSEILEKVVYTKEHGGRWHHKPDDFKLVLYPKSKK